MYIPCLGINICVPIISTTDDMLSFNTRKKLQALGVAIPRGMTEEQALALIKEIENKKKFSQKEEKKQLKNEECQLIDKQNEKKLLNSLDIISQNNKIILQLNKNAKINKSN